MVTLKPRAWRSLAREAAMMPYPNDEVTPPVTKMYLVIIFLWISKGRWSVFETSHLLYVRDTKVQNLIK